MQLDKVRNFVGKLRSVSKYEVPAVLESLMPELQDFIGYEQMDATFKSTVQESLNEMKADLERIRLTPMVPDMSATGQGTAKSKSSARSAATKTPGKGRGLPDVPNFIDPNLVKAWNRKLGILYYACDLPQKAQEACLQGLTYAAQQLECNSKVDDVVLNQSIKELDIMDKKYKRLNEDIAEFMEAQGNFMAVCLTNIGTFFLRFAGLVEAHRKAQKQLDEASADKLYDLSEDMRIQKEDAEALFEQSCQVLRASTTYEELHANFEKVLEILDKIQDSYRAYHSKACFQADKYPLSLVDEYRTYLIDLSQKFNMVPLSDHALLARYEDIYDETIRLNRKFFEEDPAAGGVAPRPVSTTDESITNSQLNPENVYESPLIVAAIKAAQAANRKKTKKEIEKEKSLEKVTALPPPSSLSGTFKLNKALIETVQLLRVEAEEEPESAAPVTAAEGSATSVPAPATLPNLSHPQCAWIRKDAQILPVSEAEELAMDEYDLRDYEKCLAKRFLPLSAEAAAALSPDDAARYARTQIVVKRAQERLAVEEDPLYIREHVPVDIDQNAWVLKFEINVETMTGLLAGLRDSVVTAVEVEADRRIKRAIDMKKDYKDEFTEELEDRLRTHWPRRGRVETGIKQPREAELLGHEEKTWRLIQNIQDKMINIQRRFEHDIAAGKDKCAAYVEEVRELEKYITTEKFRNLAKLQGVEVKARGLYIAFQAASAKRIADIRKLLDEAQPVITYAMDFRKICPPQAPGTEGGYSPAEILEIEQLMVGQCNDIRAILGEWNEEVGKLSVLQDKSSLSQGEFTKKYEQVAQDLAMSEGLGQKYGAPRRRAQERIRTEVSRDESSAGKIDEMLAKLEFEVAESIRLENAQEAEPIAETVDVAETIADNGFKQMDKCRSVWTLMSALRSACKARVDYLQVSQMDLPIPELPFAPARIAKVSEVPDAPASDIGEDTQLNLQVKNSTIDKVMEEVDKACRKETQDLYNSEGRGSMLGEGGVPESLQTWLAEAKQKILGDGGHREKAWKRLWAQVTRFEKLVGRKVGVADEDEEEAKEEKGEADDEKVPSLGIPGVCVRLDADANTRYIRYLREQEEARFMKLVRIWEKGREKHERLLRPRMSSPDAAEELADLDRKEKERSAELTKSVITFRADLIQKLAEHSQRFCEDISVSYKSLVQYIDSSMRLEALKLPPDTAIPKKRMTLKRLRKAQRLRDEIARGGIDRSKVREWPPLALEPLVNAFASVEDLVAGVIKVKVPEPVVQEPPKKGAKGAPPPVEAPPPQKGGLLLPSSWVTATAAGAVVKGSVTTAHRSLVSERDGALTAYVKGLEEILIDIRGKFGVLITQEESWGKQWSNQVQMLKSGKL